MPRKTREKRTKQTGKETVQDLNIETEAIKKTQTEEIWKWKILLGGQELQMQVSPTEQRLLGIEDRVKEIDPLVKENVKSNKFLTYNRKSGTP